jgi:membrane protease YdiL (CAAX protease family)
MNVKRQLSVLGIFLLIYSLLVFFSTLITSANQLAPPGTLPDTAAEIPQWQIALASAGIVIVLYGFLGLAGSWFARRLELPGVYREGAGWETWLRRPLLLGLCLGVICVLIDRIIALLVSVEGLPHPGFPLSLLASGSAGIGEEILFRGFVLGLWAFILNWLLRRWNAKRTALWIANVIAALAFSAAHLPSAMLLLGVTSPADLPAWVIVEGLLINGILGLVAGERYVRGGLVAAMGVHFWTDVVWHVIWPLLHSII